MPKDTMRYAIITNPASGGLSPDQKRSMLTAAAEALNTKIHGLDSASPEGFAECARDLASRCDVLVVAGGDGTLSDIINAIDLSAVSIAYLPLGTGNAMAHALGYEGRLRDIVLRIREGKPRQCDLIECDRKRRGFTMSVGITGTALRLRARYLLGGARGFWPYFAATLRAYCREYRRISAVIRMDDTTLRVKDILNLLVAKHPYYGFGMKLVPRARLDDGKLHLLVSDAGLFLSLWSIATSFTTCNRLGLYRQGLQVSIRLDRPVPLQVDGNLAWESDSFAFRLLPRAVNLIG